MVNQQYDLQAWKYNSHGKERTPHDCPHNSSFPQYYGAKIFLHHFFIHGSVHRNSTLVRSNKMQQYAGIYLLRSYSTCFGCPSHPSSGVHKTASAAYGTGHSIWAKTFLQRGLATLEEGCCSDTMTCTRGFSYRFTFSWWWVRWTPETCREWFCSK